MVAAVRRKGVKLTDPAEIHKRLRDSRTGRINRRNLKRPYQWMQDAGALRSLRNELLKRVGELATGRNAWPTGTPISRDDQGCHRNKHRP
jgi:hypothetical protein